MVTEMLTAAERRTVLIPPTTTADGPKALAALRITTGVAALLTFRGLWSFQIPPETLRFPPPGTAWLAFLPVSQTLLSVVAAVGFVASVGVVAGWRPRWTATLATAAYFYAGWATTLTGKVDHFHHVMWVLAILAVSPCANVWALRREYRAGSYRWPLMAVIILIGLVYLGAGLQKLLSAGLAWGWSDNLANTMLVMVWEKGIPVRQWLLDWPLLGRVMGLGGLLFELAFLPLLLHPKTRRLWILGPVFHLAVWVTLGISFLTLTMLYVVFLPWDRDRNDRPPTDAQRRLMVPLIAAVAAVSVIGSDLTWPIAAYPGFKRINEPVVTYGEADGRPFSELPVAEAVGAQRLTPLVYWAVAYGRVDDLKEWFEVSELMFVTVDARSGDVIGRRSVG